MLIEGQGSLGRCEGAAEYLATFQYFCECKRPIGQLSYIYRLELFCFCLFFNYGHFDYKRQRAELHMLLISLTCFDSFSS